MNAETKHSGPVDVRRVMARSAHQHWEHGDNADAEDAEAALAAVAELIEAARNASAILGHAYHTQIRGELEQDAHDAYQRLDAVIDRVGGAA